MISLLGVGCHSPPPSLCLLNLSSSSSSFCSSPQIKPKIASSRLTSICRRSGSHQRSRLSLRRSKLGDGVEEPSFFDENGVVKDMDGYLNHLSLEYDSVWDTKPSWCQPWTILLTGSGIITGSWLVLNSVVLTSIVAIFISLWWYIFLYSYPKGYSNMIAERREKIASGQEDTYGIKKGRQG